MATDVHLHLMPGGLARAASAGELAGVTWRTETDGIAVSVAGAAPSRLTPAIADWPGAAAWMDREGIDRAVVLPFTGAIGQGLVGPAAVAYARAFNGAAAEAAAASGGRLFALGVAPHGAPEAAERIATEAAALGLRGIAMSTEADGKALDDPALEPLWAAAERHRLPVHLHPPVAARAGLERFNLGNWLGHPLSTATAAATLIFGGVLDRHPGLAVVLAHGGGSLVFGIGRLEHGMRAARRGAAFACERPPAAYLRRFWYDAVVYRLDALRFLVESVGSDRVMLGTDYPFDMAMPDAADLVRGALARPAEREAVLDATARDLFRLP